MAIKSSTNGNTGEFVRRWLGRIIMRPCDAITVLPKQDSSDHHQYLVGDFLIVFKGELLVVNEVDNRTDEAKTSCE